MPLKYTPELPAVPGWYWTKTQGMARRDETPRRVSRDRATGKLWLVDDYGDWLPLDGRLFAGPIERPEEDSE